MIVVSYNSARFLPRLLRAMEAQNEPRWRLIVIDNASAPDQRPNQSQLPPRATLMQLSENVGFAAANNIAARALDTPFLAFLNPDAFPEPDWLTALLAAAERWPNAALFGSTQMSADAPDRFDGAGDVLHATGLAYRAWHGKPVRPLPPEGETFSACAAAALCRRADFNAVGGFDESFFCFCEDVDLGFRLRLIGKATIQAPNARVAHVGGGSTGSRSAFADYHGARNRLWTFVKNMPPGLFWPLLPAHLTATAMVLMTHALSGRGFAGWRGFAAGARQLPAVWRTRQRVQATRLASHAAIARALSWSPMTLLSRGPVIRSD